MRVLDAFLFICRYIPFWAIPCFFITLYYAYIYWLKDFRKAAIVWLLISLFCLTALAAFVLMGGPEQMASILTHLFA